MTWLAIGLALLNACCFTAGTWLQHSVSGDAPSLRAAARRPRWQAGLALLALGAVFQVFALRMAPVTVVEPAGVIGIVVGVLLGLRTRGERLRRSTGWALTMILVGTVAFAVLAALNTAPVPITTEALLSAGAMVAVVVACCRFAARLLHGRARFLVLGVGGGTAYGCTSTLVRAATERYAAHGIGVELLGILVGLAAAILAGFWLVQRAHAEGPPEGTVANLTVVDPLVAVSIGIGVLGEAPGLTWPIAAAGLLFAALAIGGVVRLSRDIPTGADFPQDPPSHDRSTPCPSSASSSERTPILPTSTARPTSRTAWPSVSPSVVMTSTSSVPPHRAPYPGTTARRFTASPRTAPRSIPASASASPGGSAGRPSGCLTASHPTWFTYSPISG